MTARRLSSALIAAVFAAGGVADRAALAQADDEPPEEHIDDVVARSLYERGLELFHAGRYGDARTLLVEAYARSPRGPYATLAKDLVKRCDAKLGRAPTAFPEPPGPGQDAPADPYADGAGGPAGNDAPLEDPYGPPLTNGDAALVDPYEWSPDGSVPEDPYAGGVDADELEPEDGVPASELEPETGRAGGRLSVGGLRAHDRSPSSGLYWSGALWGFGLGLMAAHVADDPGDVSDGGDGGYLMAGLIGGSLGVLGGHYWSKRRPSYEDVTLVQAVGAGGLTASLLVAGMIDPAQGRAYSLNGLMGSAVGLTAGFWLAGRYDVPAARTGSAALWAGVGVAAPYFLVNLGGEPGQGTAAVALLGLGGGAYFGWWLKRDARPTARVTDPALLSLRDGRWALGAPLPHAFHLAPSAADPRARVGLAVDLFAGTF